MPSRSLDAGCSDLVALGSALRELRELRERRQLPQVAVGYDARLCRHYMSMIEQGQLNPSFVTLLWIVRTLDVSLAELVEVYDRNLARIDPQAGSWVPVCPTPEALVYAQQVTDATVARIKASKARRARSRMR